jgi:hypothetical protein
MGGTDKRKLVFLTAFLLPTYVTFLPSQSAFIDFAHFQNHIRSRLPTRSDTGFPVFVRSRSIWSVTTLIFITKLWFVT